MGNLKINRAYEGTGLSIPKRVEMLSKQIDFITSVCELDFITGYDAPPSYLCTNLNGIYDIKLSDDERFYLEYSGRIVVIVLEFCYKSNCYKLFHNFIDLPIIENPTISQVVEYYGHNLNGLIDTLRERTIENHLAYERDREQKRIKRENEPCCIYIALDTTCGYHKVGRSKNVASRELVLMAQKPTIKVIGQFDGIAIDESNLHSLLREAGYHIRGEWFNLNSEPAKSIIIDYFKRK